MAKNIVVLCDGTSNEIASDRTNILRLFGALERSDRQIVFYDPGVGTFGAESSWSKGYRKTIEVWGLLTGWVDWRYFESLAILSCSWDLTD